MAISALPHTITASVGAAVAPYVAVADAASAIDELVPVADSAVYRAKKRASSERVE
ncbi:GGDEF domain-containing protein [Mycolicibacterium iranicum]|uniref:GGDEF domain-containing protein n=1 Tax=Mycolicibacterium iranicum TaxID=912594 RepID=A0A839QN87_MYCIR|nr:hypothetical protein [Mycolicibacterium iranicum]MBB2993591.1 GGDEF domain-containing protein [Mycolicibacterium iranicum]